MGQDYGLQRRVADPWHNTWSFWVSALLAYEGQITVMSSGTAHRAGCLSDVSVRPPGERGLLLPPPPRRVRCRMIYSILSAIYSTYYALDTAQESLSRHKKNLNLRHSLRPVQIYTTLHISGETHAILAVPLARISTLLRIQMRDQRLQIRRTRG